MIHDLTELTETIQQLNESLQEHFFLENLKAISDHKHNSRGVDEIYCFSVWCIINGTSEKAFPGH